MLKKLLILSLCSFIAAPVLADDITLDANDGVEYHQKEQKLIAKGDAVAKKKDLSIKADTLIGYYSPKSKNKISRIEAHGKVEMTTPETSTFGDKMIYDVKEDTAILNGTPAKIKSPEFSITSKGPITYYQSQQKAVANEGVEAVDNKGNHVYADLMTAWFIKDKNNQLVLDKIDIEQNVKIVSKDATVTALKGTYNAISGKIYLYDNVIINQNGNILKGSRSETDLKTSISKILSDGQKGRVSGVFKEKKKKKE